MSKYVVGVMIALLALLGVGASGCGQKGDLYLPDEPMEEAREDADDDAG